MQFLVLWCVPPALKMQWNYNPHTFGEDDCLDP